MNFPTFAIGDTQDYIPLTAALPYLRPASRMAQIKSHYTYAWFRFD